VRENLKFLVVGDTIIDENVYLKASGLSLESPTIKTNYSHSKINYGGAANVAKFLATFNRDVTFMTSLSDEHNFLFEQNNPTVKVLNFYQGNNNIKTRYWVHHGDETYKYLQVNNVNEEFSYSLLLDYDVSEFDIIAFADYRCGFITDSFILNCTKSGKITYASSQISSKSSNYDRYWDIDYIVCNKNESTYVDRKTNICVTKGDSGCEMNGISYPAYPVDKVLNTIGAGDCFYAALLASGNPEFANEQSAKYVSSDFHEQNN
jgi:bifunctional ADP-heptose synthase (sugar kinase/adenylyltransferase)